MFNLIKKDMLIQKRTLISLILFVIIYLFASGGSSSASNSYFIAVTIAYVLSIGSLGCDERFKGDIVINSLPVTRKEIIISKYIGVIIFTVLAIFFINVLSIILSLFNISIFKLSPITLKQFKTVMYSCLILSSIILPVFIKYGVNKGRIVNFILYLIFFTSATSIIAISKENGMTSITKVFHSNLIFNLAEFILIGVIFLSSMKLSIKLYSKKDF